MRRLRFTGAVVTLKPLAAPEDRDTAARDWFVRLAPSRAAYRLSWFHRSLAAGGAFAMIALLVGSGIFLGINRPAGDPSAMSVNEEPEAFPFPPEGHDTVNVLTETSPRPMSYVRRAIRPVTKRRRARPHAVAAANVRPRQSQRPKFVVTEFVPTKLIIYPENGKIVTRIEPQLTAHHKKSRRILTSQVPRQDPFV